MGCQSFVFIGNNLTFSVSTHNPETGVLSDADAVPSYRIYEDETVTSILTGVMAKLDDANTTGFYTEQIACTTANGFEHSKSYTIYIEATVDGFTGSITYAFLACTPVPALVWNAAYASYATGGTFGATLNANTPQSGDAYLRIGSPAGTSVSADVAAIKAETANIVADTSELEVDWSDGGRLDLLIDAILADTTSLNDTAMAEITGILDVPATPTIRQAIMLLYMAVRNNSQSTATERRILNDAGTEVLDATMSDNGTTFSQGKLTAP